MDNSANYRGKNLSKALKKGDLQAYNVLFNTYYARLFNYALKLANDESLAKDIVQDTFVKLWTKRKQINTDLSIANYLFKICKNEFLTYIRKENRDRTFLDELKIETAHALFVEPDDKEEVSRIEEVKEAIEKLTPKCKQAFKLSKYDGLTYKAIAEKMGISVKTVEIHISRAYTELRKSLKTLLLLWF